MVHRPELSLQRLTPANHDDCSSTTCSGSSRPSGSTTRSSSSCAGAAPRSSTSRSCWRRRWPRAIARTKIIENVATPYTVGWSIVDEVREFLATLDATTLAKHLIGGLTVAEAGLDLERLRQGVADRRGARRRRDLRPAAASQHALHARLLLLDLRRRLGQPDVLAGAAARSAQHAGDLPLPPDVQGRRFQLVVSRSLPTTAGSTRPISAGLRSRAATCSRSATAPS